MNAAPITPAPEPLAATVTDTIRLSGIRKTTLYKLISDGTLKTVCIGRRRLVLMSSLRELLSEAA